jgi:hypothetical protein
MLLVPLAALAAGCGTPGAVFVTKTSLAIADVDSTPAELTVAMHRVEGFIAPRNQNGNTPPVLAHIRSNRDLVRPEVKQVYATGTAAERLAGDFHSNNSDCDDCTDDPSAQGRENAPTRPAQEEKEVQEERDPGAPREKRVSPVIFTTSTTFGLRLGVSADNVIDGIVLGYRRKEMSFVPSLAKDKAGTYRYPSLMAAINLKTESKQFSACQGFATGTAATALAEARDSAGLGCLEEGETLKSLLGVSERAEMRQHADISGALRCYVGLSDEKRHAARSNAEMLGLVPARDPALLPTAASGDAKTMHYAGEGYYAQGLVRAVMLPKEDEEASVVPPDVLLRESLLRIHREFVCAKPPKEKQAEGTPEKHASR